ATVGVAVPPDRRSWPPPVGGRTPPVDAVDSTSNRRRSTVLVGCRPAARACPRQAPGGAGRPPAGARAVEAPVVRPARAGRRRRPTPTGRPPPPWARRRRRRPAADPPAPWPPPPATAAADRSAPSAPAPPPAAWPPPATAPPSRAAGR